MSGFSLFGGYQKPGPGVSKDAPQKPPVQRFFEVLFRKFFELVKLNLLFLVPFAVVAILSYLVGLVTGQAFLWNLPFVLLSPFLAGLTFVTRNYAREEHAFIASDFKDAVLLNWKQFSIHGIICYVLVSLITFCIRFYYTLAASQGTLFMVLFGVSIAVFLVFIFMQYYIPLMIVTFDLSLKQIYKNAFIFAIIGLWCNILLTAIFGAILFLNYFLYYMNPALVLLINGFLVLFFAFSFSSFLINFTVYPLIEKLMIHPALEPADAQSSESEGGEESTEAEGEEEKKSEPEYVFYQGKLVKKSTLENDGGSIFQDRS
ncbi:hypothetical protein [Faecalispora jeddahensis]|uniref:hypothetical protein n=1 Tax=Faecalispora jeddahensis TaxID=1414721 RepID=UPI00189BE4A5|nr:hypothetical protein [Faecalispora jeddahensis]